MPYTTEEIQAAVARYRNQTALSNPEGTWAAPNTAPMSTVAGPVDTTALTPEAASNPDWMAIARSYAQPGLPASDAAPLSMPAAAQQHAQSTVTSAPDQETGLDPSLAALPIDHAPQSPREALERFHQNRQTEAAAVRAHGESTAQSLENEASLAGEQLADMNELEAQQAEHRRIRDEKLSGLFVRAQKATDEAANASVYDRRTTGNVIAGAVGLALAAVGDGFNRMGGNTNTNAIGMIQSQLDRQLERDLQLQREAIEDKRKTAAARMSDLGIARQMGLDASATEDMSRVLLLKKQARAAEQLAKSTQAADARALAEQTATERATKADVMEAELLNKIADSDAKNEYMRALGRAAGRGGAGTGPKQLTREQLEYKRDHGGGLTGPEAQQLKYIQDADAKNVDANADPQKAAMTKGAQLSEDLIVVNPKIAPMHAKDPTKLQGQIDSARRMLDAIDQLLTVRTNHPVAFRTPYTDANSTAKSYGTTAQLEAKNVYELGALSGPDMGLIENIAGDPTDWSSATDAKLRALRKSVVKGVNDKLGKRGFGPVDLGSGTEPPPAPARNSAQGQADRIRAATAGAQVQRATSAADLD